MDIIITSLQLLVVCNQSHEIQRTKRFSPCWMTLYLCDVHGVRFQWLRGVFIWRRASPLGRASPPWRDLAIDYPRSRLGGLEIFHINALKRAGPPKRASKSKLRTHDKGCFDQHFSDNFSFHKLC